MDNEKPPGTTPQLIRHFGPLQATALNMSNMIGIGPFLTIPLLMSALGGPQAMLGWLVALLIVIDVLIATRIIVQFAGQIFAVALLRKNAPNLERPYRIWLYPLPSLVALVGWAFIYLTLDPLIILFSLAALALGALSFLAWSRSTSKWPFAARPLSSRGA